jgi:hypothetical protein
MAHGIKIAVCRPFLDQAAAFSYPAVEVLNRGGAGTLKNFSTSRRS